MSTKVQYPESYPYNEASKAESTDDECSCESHGSRTYKTNLIKFIPKWAFVLTELNVSSLMAHMNLFDLPKTLKKLIEQGNVNRFGKKEHVVTVFDANFCTMTQKWTNKRIFNKWPTISFVLRHPKAKAD